MLILLLLLLLFLYSILYFIQISNFLSWILVWILLHRYINLLFICGISFENTILLYYRSIDATKHIFYFYPFLLYYTYMNACADHYNCSLEGIYLKKHAYSYIISTEQFYLTIVANWQQIRSSRIHSYICIVNNILPFFIYSQNY